MTAHSDAAIPTGLPSSRTPRTPITAVQIRPRAERFQLIRIHNTYFDATVTGTGTVKFYYKKNAGTNDCFRFKVDGLTKTSVYNYAVDWTQYTYNITSGGSHTLRWQYEKGSSGTPSDGGAWVDRIEWIPSGSPPPSSFDPLAEATDCDLSFTCSGDFPWYMDSGTDSEYYLDADSATAGDLSNNEDACMETTVQSASSTTLKFWWKISSEEYSGYLKFYIDGQFKHQITGNVDWTEKTYSLTAGTHTLKWRYTNDQGENSGWVDYIQWSGASSPPPDPENWQEIRLTHNTPHAQSDKGCCRLNNNPLSSYEIGTCVYS